MIDEHFKLSRMSADECLIELSRLARGNGKDQIRALALLSQHHGLLNGTVGKNEQIEARVRAEVDAELNKIAREFEAEVKEVDEEKDRQWKAVLNKYQDSQIAVEALYFLRDVMVRKKSVEIEPEPEVEIIPLQRRLEPASVEKRMARTGS